jgi:TonB family protein
MKTQEIQHNDLEQLFNTFIEQAPLISEEQVFSLLHNLPVQKPGGAVKRFFHNRLNSILFVSAIVLIVVITLQIRRNSGDEGGNKNVVQNLPENTIVPAFTDTTANSSVIVREEITEHQTTKDLDIKVTSAEESPMVVPADTLSLAAIYKHFEKQPQVFTIRTDRDTLITCKEGTTIHIKARSFISEKTGNEISGSVQVVVKEYYKMSDILLSNLTTTSAGKILETGGMLHISVLSGSEKCGIKPEGSVETGFPYSERKENMALFYGEQNRDGMNWMPAETAYRIKIIQTIMPRQEPMNEECYIIVEEMPEYPGGDLALREFVSQNTQYPYSALKNRLAGKVQIAFVVEKDGMVNDISVVNGLNNILDTAAVYVVGRIPAFKPGRQRGRPVRVSYTVPVDFSLPSTVLTDAGIAKAKEFDRVLQNFKWDAPENRIYRENRKPDEFEQKVKDDNFEKTNISDVNRYFFRITRLGWINCDKFYSLDKREGNLVIPVEDGDSAIVNVVFHRLRAVIPGKIQPGSIEFKDLPLGEKVTVIALKAAGNKIFLAVKETEVTRYEEVVLDFRPVTLDFLKKEMEKLNEL